jgi:1,4-dihydroxy-2-naphthoyl-CoA hydrolase
MFLFERDVLKRAARAFKVEREVRFQDVDAAGVIFYPRLLEYFNDAYLSFLSSVGQPLHESLGRAPWVSPVRHAEADFLRPLRFGDAIEVALVGAALRPEEQPSEVTFGWRIARLVDGEPAAIGQVVHTFVDAKTFRRTPIPDTLLAIYRGL